MGIYLTTQQSYSWMLDEVSFTERDSLLKEARELRQKMIDDAKGEAKVQAVRIQLLKRTFSKL